MAEVDDVLAAVGAWAGQRQDVRALALVGSWARGTATVSSDVDLVLLTDDVAHYVERGDWITEALGPQAQLVRTRAWGVLIERRVRLPSGLEVELGFAPCSWAETDPLDPGTAAVIRDGCRPLFDADALLARLVAAVQG